MLTPARTPQMIRECLMAEFRVRDDDCPLAAATLETGAVVDAAPPLLRPDGNVLLRFEADPDDALAATLDADDRIRYLYRGTGGDTDTYRCLSMHPCVVHTLVDAGFMPESLTYQNGSAVLTGAVVGHEILTSVMKTAGETVGITLNRVFELHSEDETAVAQRWDITPAQEEALSRAVALGYFTVPRAVTADDVAADIGISKSAFLERLHRAQHSLLTQLFPDVEARSASADPDR